MFLQASTLLEWVRSAKCKNKNSRCAISTCRKPINSSIKCMLLSKCIYDICDERQSKVVVQSRHAVLNNKLPCLCLDTGKKFENPQKVIEWKLYGTLLEIEWILIIHNNCIFPTMAIVWKQYGYTMDLVVRLQISQYGFHLFFPDCGLSEKDISKILILKKIQALTLRTL